MVDKSHIHYCLLREGVILKYSRLCECGDTVLCRAKPAGRDCRSGFEGCCGLPGADKSSSGSAVALRTPLGPVQGMLMF